MHVRTGLAFKDLGLSASDLLLIIYKKWPNYIFKMATLWNLSVEIM